MIKICISCNGNGKEFNSNPNPEYLQECKQCEGMGIQFPSRYHGVIRAERANGKTKEQLIKMAKKFALEHFYWILVWKYIRRCAIYKTNSRSFRW